MADEAKTTNSSFSAQLPNLQLAWDSTSLGEFKICPRRYQLAILSARVPRKESVHLTFGLLVHSGCERYHHLRLNGTLHEDALRQVVEWLLLQTWHDNHPWNSDDKNKNRFTLIRSMVWYLDKYQSDPLRTIALASGKPAVELSFCFESGYSSQLSNEPFLLCGHFDRIAELNGVPYISDIKTTKYTINQDWFDKFTPDNQFSLYNLAGEVAFQTPTQGLIVDGWQVAITFTDFKRQIVSRSPSQISDWLRDLGFWLRYAEECVRAQYWPKNDKACNLFGGCPYRQVCSKKSPESAQSLLESQYSIRIWDPLQRRGDI